uniref:Uncharacterized protein n=1 Tax=Neogobius melanostomus TaxID=47308 RepID=A0A8C6T335_9GOBI
MNCFIIPRPSLEACFRLFKGGKRAASFKGLTQAKRHRGLGASPKTSQAVPPLTVTLHNTYEPLEQEDSGDVDVLGSSDSDLPPGRGRQHLCVRKVSVAVQCFSLEG